MGKRLYWYVVGLIIVLLSTFVLGNLCVLHMNGGSMTIAENNSVILIIEIVLAGMFLIYGFIYTGYIVGNIIKSFRKGA